MAVFNQMKARPPHQGVDVGDLYERFGPMVLRRCRGMLAQEEAALDAMQDTFVKLLRYQDRLEGQTPSSLLYRIATNVCLNKIRSAGRSRIDGGQEDLLSKIASLTEPETHLESRDLLARLFGNERESTQAMAVMHLMDRMTLEEVAQEVGMSVSGVRKRLRPLRAQLQKLEGGDK